MRCSQATRHRLLPRINLNSFAITNLLVMNRMPTVRHGSPGSLRCRRPPVAVLTQAATTLGVRMAVVAAMNHACMPASMPRVGQMTWRAPDDLVRRVRGAALRQGRSMNDYVTAVLDAATDPALSGSDAERVRERLAAAGLLAPQGEPKKRPPASAAAAARRAAAQRTSLTDLVTDSRG